MKRPSPRNVGRKVAVGLCVIAVWFASFGVAPAGADTDPHFDRGRALLEKGDFAEACTEFRLSIEAEPSVGAYLNLGECNIRQRKLGTALKALRRGYRLAKNQKDRKRARYAKKRIAELKPRLSHLKIEVEADFADEGQTVLITVDDESFETDDLDSSIVADIGLHRVTATVDDEERFRSDVRITDEGEEVSVLIKKTEARDDSADDIPTESVIEKPLETTGPTSKVPALATLGGGIVLAGFGSYFGLSARSRWADVKGCRTTGCSPDEIARGDSARFRGNVSTGLFVAAGVVTAVSAWLYLRSRDRSPSERSVEVGLGPGSVSLHATF